MSFINRAQKLRARGEDARALLVLVEGLKRHPQNEEAVDLLLHWYAVEIPIPNVEDDVVACLALQPDADDLISTIIDNLRASGHMSVAENLLQASAQAGIAYVAPPSPEAPSQQGLAEDAFEPPSEPPSESPLEAEFGFGAEPGGTAENAAAPVTKRSKPTPSEGPRRPRKIGRYVVAILLIAGATYGASIWVGQAEQASAQSSIDDVLLAFDPLRVGDLRGQVEDALVRWPQSRELEERLFFLKVVGGEAPQTSPGPHETPWGLSGDALLELQKNEIEKAIATSTRLEHSFPDEPVAFWTQGIVLEKRGKLSAAAEVYERLLARYPKFLAARLGAIRVQVRLGNLAGARQHAEKLQTIDPAHPYLAVARASFPRVEDYLGGTVEAGVAMPGVSADGFVTAVVHLQQATVALRQGNLSEARAKAELAAQDKQLVPAQLLVSTLRLAQYEPAKADEALAGLAGLEGIDADQLLLIQTVAPRAFAFAGRPELGRRYVAMFGADVEGVDGQQQGVFKTRWNEWQPRLLGALVSRLLVMNELGQTEASARLAQQYIGHAGAEELGLLVALLAEQGGAAVQIPPLEGEALLAADIARASLAGKSREVIELGGRVKNEVPWRYMVARYVAQAHLALRETGSALEAVSFQQASLLDRLFLDGMKLRVISRFGKGYGPYKELLEQLSSAEPVGVNRLVDMATGMFWQGQLKDAEAVIKRALELNPRHRQGNWLYGLVMRQRGNFRDAEQYFQRSGRDFDNSADVLIELGIALSDLGNHDEARKMFHKALLLERTSHDAMSGLGAAYVRLDPVTSARDLDRIVSGFPDGQKYAAQKAEGLKWLAVVKGVRKGKPEALGYLDAAEALVGKRADLLFERARHAEANDDHTTARALYAQALQRNSAFGEAHLGLARTAIREGDTKVARDHLEKYLELEPRGESRQWAEKKLASL